MNDFLASVIKFLVGTFLTACTTILFGLIARAYWLLFSLGWGLL